MNYHWIPEIDLYKIKVNKKGYNNIPSADKEIIILNDSYHMVLYDNEKEFVFNKTLEFIKTHLNSSKSEALSLC